MQTSGADLWKSNTPENFWQPGVNLGQDVWWEACLDSLCLLGLPSKEYDPGSLIAMILGEQRYGSNHWKMSVPKRIYYLAKPALSRNFTRSLRRFTIQHGGEMQSHWPVEDRYARFLWEVIRKVMLLSGLECLEIRNFWPKKNRMAFVITHDVETGDGQKFVRRVADLDEGLGYRSSFNFVPERYDVDFELLAELSQRGFEIGVHGLKHDGRLFESRNIFNRRAKRINGYLNKWQAVGFRCELTHRQPDWMQCLDIKYDLSFFDTDPFEPIPGGTMSIWPFQLGHFLELPYTLAQDYTLTSIINETTPRIWQRKVNFIQVYHGMALINSHPDFLAKEVDWCVYRDFLTGMSATQECWCALPREVADWWRTRTGGSEEEFAKVGGCAQVRLHNNGISIEI